MDKKCITFSIIHNERSTREFDKKPEILTGSVNFIIGTIIHYDIGESGRFNLDPLSLDLITKNLRSIIEKIKRNHNKFSYVMHSKHIRGPGDKNIKISIHTMKQYFHGVVIKVLPVELFGKSNNRNRFIKAIPHYLSMAKGETYHLEKLVDRMNISIEWLSSVKDPETKRMILLKCFKWLFLDYIDKVVENVFYVTEAFVGSSKLVFMRHCDWQNAKSRHFKRLPVELLNSQAECKMYFHAKPTSQLRPIVHNMYTPNEKKLFKIINTFLHQLAMTNFNTLYDCDFQEKWIEIQNGTSVFGNKKHLYLIKSDIKNAFGSISQILLWNDLVNLCAGLPRSLTLAKFLKRRGRSKEWFMNKEFVLPKNSVKYTNNSSVTHIDLSELLTQLKKYIFEQKFVFDRKNYRLWKGIIQGGSLSSILSDIYYLKMTQRFMSTFQQSGILFKYADDYLYVTDNVRAAKAFLELLEKGIPQYKCKFNQLKTKTNFDPKTMNLTGNDIKYLNTLINGETLETQPVYVESPRYTTNLTNHQRCNNFNFFKKRLLNDSSLKLTRLNLSVHNSDSTVICTLEKVALFQAKRCLLLLSVFPQLTKQLVKKLGYIIARSNANIRIKIATLRKDLSRTFSARVRIILWTSYKRIFSTRIDVYNSFKSFIDQMLKNRRKR